MLTVNKGHHGIEQRVVRTSTNVRSQPVQLVINVRPRLFLAFVPRCSSRIFSHGLASPEEDFGRKAPWLCRSTLIFPGLQRHAGPSSSSPFGSPVPPLSAQSNAVGADDVLTHHPGNSSARWTPVFLNIPSHARLGGIHALGLKSWRKHRVLMTKQARRCTQ